MCTDTSHRHRSYKLATFLQAIYLVLLFSFLLVGYVNHLEWTFDTESLVLYQKQGTALINFLLLAAFFTEIGLSITRFKDDVGCQHQGGVNPLVMVALFACCLAMEAANIYTLIGYALLFYFAKWIPSRRVAGVLFAYSVMWIAVAVITCMLGLTRDVISEFSYGTCHSLGFRNPNNFGMFIFLVVAFGWRLLGNRGKVPFAVMSTLVAILCFLVSGSRTATAVIVLLVVLSMLPRIPKISSSRVFTACFILLPLIMAAVSILIGVTLAFFDGGGSLDGNFASRFVEAVYAFNQDGIHLFPWEYSTPERRFYFDNAYIFWIFRGGLFAALGFFGFAVLTNWLAIKRGTRADVILVICVAVYGCMEHVLILVMLLIFVYCCHPSREKPVCQESES